MTPQRPRNASPAGGATLWVVAASILLTGCAPSDGSTESPKPERTAKRVATISQVHEETGLTLLEGPTFGPDGDLFVVDVAAPPGKPKVLRIDVDSGDVLPVFTDEAGAYTSAQFSPLDGRLHLTDFIGGRIVSITTEGSDPRIVFSGTVEEAPMNPDDLAFDESGNMYISDSKGLSSPGAAEGRIVRIDAVTAHATVLARNLPAPNGISFDVGYEGLWISQLNANRLDYLRLNPARNAATGSHAAIYFSGGRSQTDSNAVDAAGNIYQAIHGQAKVFVYSPTGALLTAVSIPPAEEEAAPESATNVAKAPGTSDAYITVSGTEGGRIYKFTALSPGIRQSNGG